MFAVVVTFRIHPKQMSAFLPLMHKNAQASLSEEVGCHQFDVCTDDVRPNEVFLYELYANEAAFQTHLASPHFKAFDAQVAGMVASKSVATYAQVAQ